MTDAPGPVNRIVTTRSLRHVGGMQNHHLLFALPLFLIGCAPLVTFYQPGVSFARLETDTVQCKVAALKQVPVANKTVQDPPDFVPPQKVCDKAGNCRVFPGRFIPGQIRTVDANAPLRARVTRQCMAARGYTLEEIPQCPASATVSVQVSPLPALTPNSCAIRNDDGSFSIAVKG